MKNKTQILAVLDNDMVRRLKVKLATDGLTYKGWLAARVEAYLAKKTTTDVSEARGHK